MSGSLEWVTCPVCQYPNACLDFELKDRSTKLYCSGCDYDSVKDGPVFVFLYRKEFRIAVLAKDLEEACIKAQSGRWVDVRLDFECGLWPEYLVLEEED